jgi:antitoxin component YwqK of YwqJK toxin-antitoxin module
MSEREKRIGYHPNRKKRYESTYKDGKKDGLWTDWYENGQKRYEGTWKDGYLISEKYWDRDGNLEE